VKRRSPIDGPSATSARRADVPQIAEVLLVAPPGAPWANEGGARHLIRRTLLIGGWTRSWHRADKEARRLVANGRLEANLKMPRGWDYNELPIASGGLAWRECDIDGVWFKPRYEDHRYCSRPCRDRAQYIRRQLEGIGALPVALRCAWCDTILEDPHPKKQFCSTKCRQRAF